MNGMGPQTQNLENGVGVGLEGEREDGTEPDVPGPLGSQVEAEPAILHLRRTPRAIILLA